MPYGYETIRKSAGQYENLCGSFRKIPPLRTLRDRVGKTVVYRPVNLAREMARLEAMQKRTGEDEDLLKLLNFRNKVILDRLTVKPSP